ncbi:MAG: PSD1 and planctomycete cytochrome C domain-containing protein [Planctomycetaceae bacterium]
MGAEKNPGQEELFENQIRPFLLKHCIECHSNRKSESGLRLDSRENMLTGGDSGPVIFLDNPGESLLLKALNHEEGYEMPPSGKLDADTISVISKWLDQGAIWPEGVVLETGGPQLRGGTITDEERQFWSYQPVQDPTPPALDGAEVISDIDRFLQKQLDTAGIKTVAPASRSVWLRRVIFDLTGLPPTPEEVTAFEQDNSPEAYSKVIERLLASTAYGERWGRHWLDVVRYADTAGETADYPVPLAYKYRNWVINAFNADLPYDEFIRQQIAGDLIAANLPEPQTDQELREYRELQIATGYIAISRRFGFDVENYHHLTIQDTIDVMGQSVLGLTLGCARCHDHKFDPVNMSDYYGLYGIFDSTRYSFPGSEEKKRPYDLYPEIPPALVAEAESKYQQELSTVETELNQLNQRLTEATEEINSVTGSSRYFGFEELDLGTDLSSAYVKYGSLTVTQDSQSPFKNAFAYGSRGISFPENSDNNAILAKFEEVTDPKTVLHYNIDFRNTSNNKNTQRAYRFYLGHGPGNSAAVEVAVTAKQLLLKDGAQYREIAELEVGEWYNLQLAINLSARTFGGVLASSDEEITFSDAQFTSGWDGVIDTTFVDNYGPGDGNTPAHEIDNLSIATLPFPPAGSLQPSSSDSIPEPAVLAEKLDLKRELQKQADHLNRRKKELETRGAIPMMDRVYGAIDKETPHDSRIQLRGEITRPGEEVPRRNLDILGATLLPEPTQSGRLQLANWWTSNENPLFARVMVNRIWQHHFGKGLVGTENDFGVRGERPSHPELLDWLASRFKESGYSVKAMHRLILNSAAYRRSTAFNETAYLHDPDARLLWRFTRRRLSAEEIRDSMLMVGGNLDRSMGEAHPFPAVESWGFTQHNPYYGVYPTSRRSVYLMQQRLKRHPFLSLFDGADTNVSTAHRALTTVPTQALYLMNNEFVHEQAAAFQKRLFDRSETETLRIRDAFTISLARTPTPTEEDEALTFLNTYRKAAIDAGMSTTDAGTYAWHGFLRTLLTRNEFLYVD